jgi:translation initiation factor 1 (eIF-1/SUI1)
MSVSSANTANTASTKISTPTIVLSNIVPINLVAVARPCGGGGGGGVHNDMNDDDDVFGHKIMISVHRAKKTITKIEGIPDKFNLVKILKKLKSKDVLSCGGHIAKDKETGKDFIVVQGSYSTEIAAFLAQEGIAEERFIVYRGG